MLVEFSVGNFRSIKDIQTIHFQAAKIKSKYKEVDEHNVFDAPKGYQLLKNKVIYGANASGKSNFFKALDVMKNIISNSFKDEDIILNKVEPYILSTETENEPTFFQIVLINNEVLYRYGFQVFKGKVVDEWLFGTPNKKEVYYFTRESNEIEINKNQFSEAVKIAQVEEGDLPLYKETALFLTVAAALNRKLAKELVTYLTKILILTGLEDKALHLIALGSLGNKKLKPKIQELLGVADLSIKNIEKVEIDTKKGDNSDGKLRLVMTEKDFFTKNKKAIYRKRMNMTLHESQGTKKFFGLSPILLLALEEKNSIIFIDEFDARLHPRLTRKIIELFNSKETNPNNAQLIVIVHDTSLMDAKLLRRDQISFVEKDKYGASQLYSLAKYKGVRNDASFEKDYLSGRYGAVPFLNQMDSLFYQDEIKEYAEKN